MQFYMAPLEGITGYVFRNTHYACFHPADKYFTPFITPGLNSKRTSKALKDVLPENNKGPFIIPQILTNRADEFIYTEKQLKEMGYTEINLNLGCPSGTVVGKRRGSGFLAFKDELNAFLEEIYNAAEVKISIKTRIGRYDPEEFDALLDIYNQYPLEELIIHPRTREDFYGGKPNMEAFELGLEKSRCPVCYNGDIFTKEDYENFIKKYPQEQSVMIGRGLIANPALLDIILGKSDQIDRQRLREFHDQIYEGYKEIMYGETPHLFKMKEIWNYMICLFDNSKKYGKKIRKVQKLKDYDAIIDTLFETEEIVKGAGFRKNE